jgi:hypothetical protein
VFTTSPKYDIIDLSKQQKDYIMQTTNSKIITSDLDPIVSVWTQETSPEGTAVGVKGYMNLSAAAAIYDFEHADLSVIAYKLKTSKSGARIKAPSGFEVHSFPDLRDKESKYWLQFERNTDKREI